MLAEASLAGVQQPQPKQCCHSSRLFAALTMQPQQDLQPGVWLVRCSGHSAAHQSRLSTLSCLVLSRHFCPCCPLSKRHAWVHNCSRRGYTGREDGAWQLRHASWQGMASGWHPGQRQLQESGLTRQQRLMEPPLVKARLLMLS
jgi:hypothetical protein